MQERSKITLISALFQNISTNSLSSFKLLKPTSEFKRTGLVKILIKKIKILFPLPKKLLGKSKSFGLMSFLKNQIRISLQEKSVISSNY